MSKNFISASVIASLILVWLVSGLFVTPPESSEEAASPAIVADTTQAAPSDRVSRVRVSRIDAEARNRSVTLRGRTEAKRIVEVTAEVAGQVVSRSVERGMQVSRGQLLCEIAIDDREVAVEEARAGLDKAQIEHAGSARLADQGLLSEVGIAASEARRQAAEAHLQRQILNLARTRITAPFDGVVEDLHLDEGDYAMPGDSCATLIDLDPMLVMAQVSLQVSLGDIWAHRVPSSLLSLNEQSVMGVRLVDANNRVVFRAIEIVEEGPNGMWVTGLPSSASVITVGQEYVRVGTLVDPVYADSIDDQVVTR